VTLKTAFVFVEEKTTTRIVTVAGFLLLVIGSQGKN